MALTNYPLHVAMPEASLKCMHNSNFLLQKHKY